MGFELLPEGGNPAFNLGNFAPGRQRRFSGFGGVLAGFGGLAVEKGASGDLESA
jgi:hypothetical protein